MKRFGGWTRIGIVISILWSLAVFGFAAIEYFEFSKEQKENLSLSAPPKGFAIESRARGIFFEWQPIDLLAKNRSAYVRDFQLRGGLLSMMWLSPIIVLWVFTFVLISTFKWVKAGFSRNSNVNS